MKNEMCEMKYVSRNLSINKLVYIKNIIVCGEKRKERIFRIFHCNK